MKRSTTKYLTSEVLRSFGAATYVKDLAAGKLDACARVGHFVGYDSESKGYQIY